MVISLHCILNNQIVFPYSLKLAINSARCSNARHIVNLLNVFLTPYPLANTGGGEHMKKKTTGMKKTAIGFLAGLILVSLLLIVPVAADAGEIVAWGYDGYGQCSDVPPETGFTQVSAGGCHSLALTGDDNGSINTPEFPTLALPSMLIVGLAGVVLLARRRQ